MNEETALETFKLINLVMEAIEGTSKDPFYTAITAVAERNGWSTPLVLLYFNKGKVLSNT